MKTVAQLQSDIKLAKEVVSVLEKELYQAQQVEFGISPGDIVIHRGVRYRVGRIEFWTHGGAWLYGFKEKKKGGFGERQQWLGSDFEKVTA